MKMISLLIFIAFFISGCNTFQTKTTVTLKRDNSSSGGRTTCSPLFFTTSSTTVDCDQIRFGDSRLPEDQLLFLARSYPQVSEEASVGHGEYLYALSELLSCEDSGLLAEKLRANYSIIFNDESNPESSLQQIHSLVENDSSLRNSCSITS